VMRVFETFGPRAQMHTSVERMGELSGTDAVVQKDTFTEVEAVVIEVAETALAEVKTRVEQMEARETPAEPAGTELDPTRPNA
jgi:hypothetical protein